MLEHLLEDNLLGAIKRQRFFVGRGGVSDLGIEIFDLADVNGECQVNGIDVVYLVNYLRGGAPPIDGDCE
jgi:hypothetical protein